MKKRHRYKVSIALLAGMVLMASTTLCGYGQSIPGLLTDAKMQQLGLETSASEFMAQKVRLKYHQVSIEKLLKYLEQEKHVQFSYSKELLADNPKVTVNLENVTLDEALKVIFRDTNIQYFAFKGGYVVLRENKFRFIQETVSGTVTDASTGETLPGVNIVVKGTTTGTSTDSDGEYELTIESLQDTLVFSFIGYQTREVPINGRTDIDVELQTQAVSGDELVVVGYGTQQKSDLTGSISSISEGDFNEGVNTSVNQLMQGRAAGVQISQTSGEPGGGVSVRIRGSNSINAGNEPLYVIDGQPISNSSLLPEGGTAGLTADPNSQDPLNSLNPSDIESIEILKDASATAIYGSRGSNGVVLITTKKGSRGDIQVDYEGYIGIQTAAKTLDILNTQEYINVVNGISEDGGTGPVFSQSEINNIGEGTDWQEQIYRTAPVNNHNLSMSGGNETTTFRTSVNYMNQEGILNTSGVTKYIARLNVNSDIANNARAGININASVVNNNANFDGTSIDQQGGPITTALFFDPTLPVFNSDGSYAQSQVLNLNNPVAYLEGVSNISNVNRTFGSLYFEYDIVDNLNARLDFGYDRLENRREVYNSSITIGGRPAGGIASIAELDNTNVNVQYTMNYQAQIDENNSLNVLGGITYEKFENELFSGQIQGFPSDEVKTNNLALGDTGNDNLNSNLAENTLLSYLGRVNYSLANKYLLTTSLRVDGSSRFGANNKYGYFPSVALGWKLAEENFIPEIFEELKLRLRWGMTGNQEIGNNQYISTFTPSASSVLNDSQVSSIAPSRISNPDLKWEATEEYNVGVDASIMSGRFSGSINYFLKTTSDMLVNLPLPRSSGYNSILSNIGEMENKGIEVQVRSTNIRGNNFFWSTTFNFVIIENEVTDIGDLSSINTGFIDDVGNSSIVREGDPLFSYFGYQVDGIFQTDDNIATSAQPGAEPGHPKFRDVNGDGSITPDDRVILGNPYPDFTLGISNSFSYKNLSLDFFITGSQGADLLSLNLVQSYLPKNQMRNRVAEVGLDRWTTNNTDAKWPSGVNPSSYGGGNMNSLVIEDASYVRLQNLKVSYEIPQEFIRSATVYLTGQNLVTITDYVGANPEANTLGRNNVRWDNSGYPLARTFLLGVNLDF